MAHQHLEMFGIYSRKHFAEPTIGRSAECPQVTRLWRIQRHPNVHKLAAHNVVDISEHRVAIRILFFHDRTLLTSCRADSILSLTCPIYINASFASSLAAFHASGSAARYASNRLSVTASHAPANRSKFTAFPRSCSKKRWRGVRLNDSNELFSHGGRQPIIPLVKNAAS